jgi:hypothetical protein
MFLIQVKEKPGGWPDRQCTPFAGDFEGRRWPRSRMMQRKIDGDRRKSNISAALMKCFPRHDLPLAQHPYNGAPFSPYRNHP